MFEGRLFPAIGPRAEPVRTISGAIRPLCLLKSHPSCCFSKFFGRACGLLVWRKQDTASFRGQQAKELGRTDGRVGGRWAWWDRQQQTGHVKRRAQEDPLSAH